LYSFLYDVSCCGVIVYVFVKKFCFISCYVIISYGLLVFVMVVNRCKSL